MNQIRNEPQNGIRKIVFGESRGGKKLEEYQWGDQDKSILFLSGFAPQDAPAAELLRSWIQQLAQGKITSKFNLNSLKSRCRIRCIPLLNPDRCKINRIGIDDIFEKRFEINKNRQNSPQTAEKNRLVDLNRNFNADWIKMHRENPRRTDLGPFPESEPETAALTRRMKGDLPAAAVILRYGENVVYYPPQATERERREALLLSRAGGLRCARKDDGEGSALLWLTGRGVKAVEIEMDGKGSAEGWEETWFLCAGLT